MACLHPSPTKIIVFVFINNYSRDRCMRSKPDAQINKKHTTEYKVPEHRINGKPDDQIICPVFGQSPVNSENLFIQ